MTATTIRPFRRMVRLGWILRATCCKDGKVKSKRDRYEDDCGSRKIRRVVRKGR